MKKIKYKSLLAHNLRENPHMSICGYFFLMYIGLNTPIMDKGLLFVHLIRYFRIFFSTKSKGKISFAKNCS